MTASLQHLPSTKYGFIPEDKGINCAFFPRLEADVSFVLL